MRLEDVLLRTVKRDFLKKHGFFFRREYFDRFFCLSVVFLALSSFFIGDIDLFFILMLLSQVSMAFPSVLIFFRKNVVACDDGYRNFYIYIQKNQFVSMLFLSGFFYLFKPDSQTSNLLPSLTASCFSVVFVLSFVSALSLSLMKIRAIGK